VKIYGKAFKLGVVRKIKTRWADDLFCSICASWATESRISAAHDLKRWLTKK
jgi:hypothetical protein